jgi:hypothetical protein
MTPFVEAALQQLASRVRCPGCTALNLEHCAPTLEINPKDWTVFCSICSFKGPLGRFLINGVAL